MSTTKGKTEKDIDCASGGHGQRKTPRRWKTYEEEFLLAMHNAGKTVKEMSDKLDRTEGAIAQKLSKLQKAEEERKKQEEEKKIMAALTCPQCKKTFDTQKGVKIHIGRAHKKKEEQEEEKEKPKPKKEADDKKKKDKKDKKLKKEKKEKKHKKSKKRKREETNNNNKNTITVHNNVVLQQQEVEIRPPPTKKQKVEPKPKEAWTKEKVSEWIHSLGSDYPKYADKIEAAGFDGEIMCASDASDLVGIVDSKTHRKIIFLKWNKM
eukprot:273378_1